MTRAGFYEHHLPFEDITFWTAEFYLRCDRGLGCAAPTVCADTAELGSVQPGAGTA